MRRGALSFLFAHSRVACSPCGTPKTARVSSFTGGPMAMIDERRCGVMVALGFAALACNGEAVSRSTDEALGRGAQALSAAGGITSAEAPATPSVARGQRQHPRALSSLAQHARELLSQPITSKARLTLVFVLDGMRPDLINGTDT